ncbi:MAG: hypothetical protein GX612_06715, partial [Bacteroidales bacterium]|nr:hypothetical protein [Bacteroidales bacterium]
MKKLKIALTIICITVLFSTMTCNAATGRQGLAAYRDGALNGLNWHAGIMTGVNYQAVKPVVHMYKENNVPAIRKSSWSVFKNGNSFKGYYKPQSGISYANRDKVMATARSLIGEGIGYKLSGQIGYP